MMTLSIVPTDPVLIELIGALGGIGSNGGLRYTERAVEKLSSNIAWAWQQTVGSKHVIEKKKLTPFSHAVFSRDDVVHWLEYGLKPFDMKMTHPFGKKSRVVKPRKGSGGKVISSWTQTRKDGSTYTVHAGDPYLIIPMRHKTAGQKNKEGDTTSPRTLSDVYSKVQKGMKDPSFERSFVTTSPSKSDKIEPNYWKVAVNRAKYSWGTRFSFPEDDTFKNLRGMVVMGEKGDSQFMTFRVVSVNSPSSAWMHPGIKARHNLANILERGRETMQGVIEDALRRDFR